LSCFLFCLDAAAGGTEDFAKGKLGVKYAYCVELRPGQDDSTDAGFILPASQIPLVGREIYTGVKAIMAEISRTYSVLTK
jgi:hypothetical protein